MESWSLLIGEAVHDVTLTPSGVRTAQPGGSAANQAVGLARLGHRVLLGTCWGDDEAGRLLAAHVAASGVELACDPVTLDRTASALVRLNHDGHPSYELDVAWRLAPLELPASAPVVVGTGSYAAVLDEGPVLECLARWRGQALTFYDVNVRTMVTGTGEQVRRRTRELLANADLVKVSDEDLDLLWPGESHEALIGDWLAGGVRAVLLSRGGAGLTWIGASSRLDVTAPSVDVVDTVGAGDSLSSAVLHGLIAAGCRTGEHLAALDESALTDVLSLATRAAGITVSRSGANPPWLHEL